MCYRNRWGGAQGWCRPSCIPITVILILIVLVVLLPLLDHAADKYTSNGTNFDFDTSCMNGCNLSFVETLPIGMSYTNNTVFLDNTYDSWIKLISLAREKIEIASFYWTMRREDVYPDDSAKQVCKQLNFCVPGKFETIVSGWRSFPFASRSGQRSEYFTEDNAKYTIANKTEHRYGSVDEKGKR